MASHAGRRREGGDPSYANANANERESQRFPPSQQAPPRHWQQQQQQYPNRPPPQQYQHQQYNEQYPHPHHPNDQMNPHSYAPHGQQHNQNSSNINRMNGNYTNNANNANNANNNNTSNTNRRRRHWSDMTRTIAHYERIEQIGEGTYGQVYKARCKDSNEIVAMKKIRVHHGAHWGMPPTVIREIKILKTLVHPNLVRMCEVVSSKGVEHLDADDYHKGSDKTRKKNKYNNAARGDVAESNTAAETKDNSSNNNNNSNEQNDNNNNNNSSTKQHTDVADARESYKGNLFLVLEYVPHDLTGLLDVAYKFQEVEIKCIFRQLLEALRYMHDHKYVHRDIKSSNILIDRHFRLKLADFGLARSIEPPLLDKLHDRGNSQEFTNKVITLWYRPPELLLGATKYGPAVDIWSAGCILTELVLGKPLFTGKTEMDQLQLIFDMVGTPTPKSWPGIQDLKLLRTGDVSIDTSQQKRPKLRERYHSKMQQNAPGAIHLVEKLLELDPSKRLTASRALNHRYFMAEPRAPDRPEMLGEMKLAEGGSFHEFETKKKRKEAKAQAEKIKQAALEGGHTAKEAQEEYDAMYRGIMEKVALEGLQKPTKNTEESTTKTTSHAEPEKHETAEDYDLDENGDRHHRSSSSKRHRQGERSSKSHRDKDHRRESSSSRGHRDKRSSRERSSTREGTGGEKSRDRDRERKSRDERERSRSSHRRTAESDDRRKRKHRDSSLEKEERLPSRNESDGVKTHLEDVDLDKINNPSVPTTEEKPAKENPPKEKAAPENPSMETDGPMTEPKDPSATTDKDNERTNTESKKKEETNPTKDDAKNNEDGHRAPRSGDSKRHDRSSRDRHREGEPRKDRHHRDRERDRDRDHRKRSSKDGIDDDRDRDRSSRKSSSSSKRRKHHRDRSRSRSPPPDSRGGRGMEDRFLDRPRGDRDRRHHRDDGMRDRNRPGDFDDQRMFRGDDARGGAPPYPMHRGGRSPPRGDYGGPPRGPPRGGDFDGYGPRGGGDFPPFDDRGPRGGYYDRPHPDGNRRGPPHNRPPPRDYFDGPPPGHRDRDRGGRRDRDRR